MKETKVKSKFNGGITLIALVITIIVMLILAGVAISALTGENGVLKQATNASEKTTIAKEEELIKLAYNAALMEKLANGNKDAVTADELKNQLQKDNADVTISASGTNPITIEFGNNTYTVDKEGKVGYIVGIVEEPKSVKWIYNEIEAGKIEITGIDLTGYETNNDGDGTYWLTMKLGVETLTVPSTIDGKTVVKFDLKDTIMPLEFEEGMLGFSDVKKVVYADTIEEIANNYYRKDIAFINAEEIHLPNNLKVLGDWACTESKKLKSITIPETVTSIGYRAFSHCETLQSIVIPDNVTSIANDAFSYCKALKSIEIPDGVTSIGDNTFKQCNSLQSVTIPESVTSIGARTFNGCSSLQSIDINKYVTSIGDYAFSDCGTVNFLNGKNETLTIPSDKWGASKVVVSGVEQ